MDNILKDKVILIVDDEQDILDTVEESLDMCIVHKANENNTGHQFLSSYTYDIVILDIMGVDGFDLLKHSVSNGFPTLMLTAHALTPKSLKKSIKMGAVFFLPKEKLSEIKEFLTHVMLGEGKSLWNVFFGKLGDFFNSRFGPDWKQKDKFFKEFEKTLKEENE